MVGRVCVGFVCVAALAAGPGSDAGGDDVSGVRPAHAWRVDDREPPAGGQVAHFLVPAARMWDDVVYTCQNQRIFCSEDCVAIWLNGQDTSTAPCWTCRRCGGSRPVGTRAVSSVAMSAASRALPQTTCAASGSPARSGASPRGDRRRAPVGVPVIRPGESTANSPAKSGPASPAAPTKPASGAMSSAPNPRHRLNWAAAVWRSCARGCQALSRHGATPYVGSWTRVSETRRGHDSQYGRPADASDVVKSAGVERG